MGILTLIFEDLPFFFFFQKNHHCAFCGFSNIFLHQILSKIRYHYTGIGYSTIFSFFRKNNWNLNLNKLRLRWYMEMVEVAKNISLHHTFQVLHFLLHLLRFCGFFLATNSTSRFWGEIFVFRFFEKQQKQQCCYSPIYRLDTRMIMVARAKMLFRGDFNGGN